MDASMLKRVILVMEDLLQEYHPNIPDKNCSCHINPPCSDCVDWGFEREQVKDAKQLLAELKTLQLITPETPATM